MHPSTATLREKTTHMSASQARHCFLCRSLDHMSTECPLRSNEPKQKDPPWVKDRRQGKVGSGAVSFTFLFFFSKGRSL